MATTKALLLLQLSLLLSFISTTVHTDAALEHPLPPSPAPSPHPHHHHHHHHHHPPTPAPAPHHQVHPPVKPPTKPAHPPVVKPPTKSPVPVHPPVKPPTKAPVHPPVKPVYPPVKPPTSPLPVRKLLAIQGVVYCKSCKHKGVATLVGANPLLNAVVKLQCNNTKQGFSETAVTDKNGYFVFRPKKVTTMAFHKCKVFLVSSKNCSVLTNLHGGVTGAVLIPDRKPQASASPFQYFNVGPFAFEPSKKCY